MKAAAPLSVKVWLSCEFTHTDADSVSNATLMAGRHAIMSELVAKGYTQLASFYGWYFSSEAYLTGPAAAVPGVWTKLCQPEGTAANTTACPSCFPEAFMVYIRTMANWSNTLTPGAKKFVSPYGTKSAVASDAFVAQLQALDVDVVAYQDEVGCIRDSLPVEASRRAFAALREAHSRPGTPALWANIESFTWQKQPNFAESALIPAAFPRILAQLDAVSSVVDRVISFTAEAIYNPPAAESAAPPWGPPAAVREWSAYTVGCRGRGRLSAISVFLCKSVLYGAFVWARGALKHQKRRFPARAVNLGAGRRSHTARSP
jgi:hypothetical protein